MASRDRWAAAARPPSSGWANGTSGWRKARRNPSKAGWRKNGEVSTSGWTAEQTSWRKPGRVVGSVRQPPPALSAPSTTVTDRPKPSPASRPRPARSGPNPPRRRRRRSPRTAAGVERSHRRSHTAAAPSVANRPPSDSGRGQHVRRSSCSPWSNGGPAAQRRRPANGGGALGAAREVATGGGSHSRSEPSGGLTLVSSSHLGGSRPARLTGRAGHPPRGPPPSGARKIGRQLGVGLSWVGIWIEGRGSEGCR